MKIHRLLAMATIVLSIFTFSNCDNKDEPSLTEQQIYLERLSKTWVVDEVTLDDVDVTEYFNNMSLTIQGDRTYIVTNSQPKVWPASGDFTLEKIAGDEHFRFIRNDGIEIIVASLTASQITFTFQYDAAAARTKGISGMYRFTMKATELASHSFSLKELDAQRKKNTFASVFRKKRVRMSRRENNLAA